MTIIMMMIILGSGMDVGQRNNNVLYDEHMSMGNVYACVDEDGLVGREVCGPHIS